MDFVFNWNNWFDWVNGALALEALLRWQKAPESKSITVNLDTDSPLVKHQRKACTYIKDILFSFGAKN